jgi:hypothetical protein
VPLPLSFFGNSAQPFSQGRLVFRFMTSDNATIGFQYSDFKPVVPRKKRKNKVQSERPSLLTLVQRASEELAKDDWNAQCQRPFHLLHYVTLKHNVACRNFARPFNCPFLVSFSNFMSRPREPVGFAQLSCSARLFTRDMQIYRNCRSRAVSQSSQPLNAGVRNTPMSPFMIQFFRRKMMLYLSNSGFACFRKAKRVH